MELRSPTSSFRFWLVFGNLDIDDDRWKRAMDAIRAAMRVVGSKTYVRCHVRANQNDEWRAITIDLAKA